MKMDQFQLLPVHYIHEHILSFLNLKSLVQLDTAFINRSHVIDESTLAETLTVVAEHDPFALRWLNNKRILIPNLVVLLNKEAQTFPQFFAFPCHTEALSLCCSNKSSIPMDDQRNYFEQYTQLKKLRLYMCSTSQMYSLSQLTMLEVNWAPSLTDQEMEKVCLGCRNLQHIILRFCTKLSHKSVIAIANSYPEILTLHLVSCGSDFDDACLVILSGNCKLLQDVAIIFDAPTLLTDGGIISLAQGCGGALKRLAISSIIMTDAAVNAVGNHCPNLEYLHIRSLDCLTNVSFGIIASAFPNLHSLHTDISAFLTVNVVVDVVRNCRGLRTLVLTGRSYINDKLIIHLYAHLSEITALGLPQAEHITDLSIAIIATTCPKLCKIDISGCHGLTKAALTALADYSTALQVFHACGSGFLTDASLTKLVQQCAHLTEVDVRFCDELTSVGIASLLQHCPIRYLLTDGKLMQEVPRRLRPPFGEWDLDQFE